MFTAPLITAVSGPRNRFRSNIGRHARGQRTAGVAPVEIRGFEAASPVASMRGSAAGLGAADAGRCLSAPSNRRVDEHVDGLARMHAHAGGPVPSERRPPDGLTSPTLPGSDGTRRRASPKYTGSSPRCRRSAWNRLLGALRPAIGFNPPHKRKPRLAAGFPGSGYRGAGWIRNPCRPCRPCRPEQPARPSSAARPPRLPW